MKSAKAFVTLVSVVALAGCGGATGTSSAASGEQPGADAAAVVLRVEQSNESMGPRNRLNFLPETTVYADGRVVQQAPFTLASAGENPALPAMLERTLTPAGLDALVERARAAGVGSGADLGNPPVMDAPTTHFTLNTGQGTASTDAYALRISAGLSVPIGEPVPSPSIPVGSGGSDGTLTQGQADARYQLLDLSESLDDLSAALGPDQVGEQEPYRPQAVAVLASPTPSDQELSEAMPWPGPALGTQQGEGAGASCTVVRGQDFDRVLEAAAGAQRWTPWAMGGRTWYLGFRPLLPDEDTCEDLTAPLSEA